MDLCRVPLSSPKKGMIEFTLGVIVRHAWCVQGHRLNNWHHTSPSQLWAEWAVNSRRKVVRMSNPAFVSDTLGTAASDHSVQKPWAADTEARQETDTHPVTSKEQGPHVLGAAVKHTGWRNKVPRAVSFSRMGWLQALCLLLGCSGLDKERAVRSVALTEFLLLRRKHREWGRMVPPALCLALPVKAAICTLKSNKSKYKFWHVLICVFH